eukprot:CAMPEP_0198143034 /NCGR_PEP_ID=MMETSP1443-20131203/5663_1 /TAXON_ID=186043 /ORGANISM="Entomoneis sp., Strain CCMP2396" /LENGTH=113 /DNA_ID=CAMNT_0043806171 /DNA_START=289 /DNA_END=630 /DNA_ORIENTATION=-
MDAMDHMFVPAFHPFQCQQNPPISLAEVCILEQSFSRFCFCTRAGSFNPKSLSNAGDDSNSINGENHASTEISLYCAACATDEDRSRFKDEVCSGSEFAAHVDPSSSSKSMSE